MNKPIKEKLRWAAIGLGLRVLALVLRWVAWRDPWMARALREFSGSYRFESAKGEMAQHLVLGGGRVRVQKERPAQVDFTITLYNPDAIKLGSRPENLLEVIIGNRIGQTGNLFYIFQFGFLISLLQRYFAGRRRSAAPDAAPPRP